MALIGGISTVVVGVFTYLGHKVTRGLEALDARIDRLEAKVDRLDLKLDRIWETHGDLRERVARLERTEALLAQKGVLP